MKPAPDVQGTAGEVARLASRHSLCVAAAESLTSGSISVALGAAPDAASWFRGSVVAYTPEVKVEVLGASPGPVVTRETALDMVEGACRVLGADTGVAVTGVGGPAPQEGQPPGTVWVAVKTPALLTAHQHLFEGDPEEVVDATTAAALTHLVDAITADASLAGDRRASVSPLAADPSAR